MFGFLTPARREAAGPLASVAERDHFWRLLPRNDPLVGPEKHLRGARRSRRAEGIQPRRAPCAAGTRPAGPGAGRCAPRQLFRPQRPGEALRAAVLAFGARVEPIVRVGAAIICCCSCATISERARWREYAPAVVLRIFRHRQVEFLLRPFINDAPIPETWAELHSAYQFADAQGWSHHPIPDKGEREEDAPASTLQKEYVHILLLELMNGGQFSPYDAFWLSRWIPTGPRWCRCKTTWSKAARKRATSSSISTAPRD